MKLKDFVARKFQIELGVAEQEIKQGLVTINDVACLDPNYEIADESIEEIRHKERHIYSVSQLKKYMTCPYSYKLAYIDDLESEKVFIGTMLGSTFHKCMEENVNPDDLEKITQIFNDVKQEYIDKNVEISLPPKGKKNSYLTDKEWEVKLINDAIVEVSNFIRVTPKSLTDLFVEQEKEINFKVGDYTFVGYVDFVADGMFGDFKTTYSFNYFNPEDYKLQLAIYSYALGIREALLVVYSRNDDTKIKIFKYKFTEEQINEYVNLAKKICFAIENEIFWKKNAKWVWNWMYKRMALTDNWCDRVCGFKTHCFGEPPEKEKK